MPYFRKKPVVIEAIQIRINLLGPVEGAWLAGNPFNACRMRRPKWWSLTRVPMIKTLEGWLTVSPDDWIVKGVRGEFYPVKPDIFDATYEPFFKPRSGGSSKTY